MLKAGYLLYKLANRAVNGNDILRAEAGEGGVLFKLLSLGIQDMRYGAPLKRNGFDYIGNSLTVLFVAGLDYSASTYMATSDLCFTSR